MFARILLPLALATTSLAPAQDLDDLLQDVKSRDYDRATRAISRARRAEGGLDVLLVALENKSAPIRMKAAEALGFGFAGEQRAVEGLVAHLAEHRPVQYFGDVPGALQWAQILKELTLNLTLPALDSKPSKPPELDDPAGTARRKAIQALGLACDNDPARYMEAIADLHEPDGMHLTSYSDVRLGWAMAFAKRDLVSRQPILDGLASDDPSWQACALGAHFLLEDLTPQALEPVLALCDSESAAIRYRALQILEKLAPPPAAARPILERRHADEVLAVRAVALLRHLGLFDDEPAQALELTLEALAQADVDVVALGVMCAGRLDASDPAHLEPLVKPLIKLLAHKDPWFRRTSAWSLGELGPAAKSARSALLERARDKDESVKSAARAALEKLKG